MLENKERNKPSNRRMMACCVGATRDRNSSNRSQSKRLLQSYRDIFIGSSESAASTAQVESLPLRTLDASDISEAWEAKMDAKDGSSPSLFGPRQPLRSFVMDCLIRKRPLSSITDVINDCVEDEMLSEWPFESGRITSKDIFIALLAATKEDARAGIANLALRSPLPLCFCIGEEQRSVWWEAFYDVLLEGDGMIVWMGPAKGKTCLLESAGLVDPNDAMLISLDINDPATKPAITHDGSVDLICGSVAGSNHSGKIWIADVHGDSHCTSFQRCIDALVMHSLLVLHVTAANFSKSDKTLNHPYASYAKVIIWRDYEKELHDAMKEQAEKLLPKATFICLPDLSKTRPQRVSALSHQLYNTLRSIRFEEIPSVAVLEAHYRDQKPPDTLTGRSRRIDISLNLQKTRSRLLLAKKKEREMLWTTGEEARKTQAGEAKRLQIEIKKLEGHLKAESALPQLSTQFFLDEVISDAFMRVRRLEEFRRFLATRDDKEATLESMMFEAILHSEMNGLDANCTERLLKTVCDDLRYKRPVQLLQGDPLQMGGKFLKNVLNHLGADLEGKPLRVISVIGMQSSAKSTLLNFLFGLSFEVSSGRCTRGLYASFLTTDKYAVLVLDSEGLLSVETRGDIFDGQMTLMCLACSHIVLMNHKGELTRQLQDLLEISLFALRHLRLTKHKPWINFVLRDQQDRSKGVHEDMLKLMKSNLDEAAVKIGVPLDELIRMTDTSVFLLPSAYTVERMQCDNREVKWTSALFSQEVLDLRVSVMEMFDKVEDAEFNESMELWYQHAQVCWETLVEYGTNLLHYKTVQEIETRKDLAEVANVTTEEVLGSDGGSGLRKQCNDMIRTFQGRIQEKKLSKLEMETIDLECNRALQCLRNEAIQRSTQLFDEKAKEDQRFNVTMREEARRKLAAPFDWVYENYLYTWKLSLKKANDEQEMSRMWLHFIDVLNEFLRNSRHQQSITEDDSREMFRKEWQTYYSSFEKRLRGIMRTDENLRHEVTLMFNTVCSRMHHTEGGAFALLQESGPQVIEMDDSLLDIPNEEWEDLYFRAGWWDRLLRKGKELFSAATTTAGGGGGGSSTPPECVASPATVTTAGVTADAACAFGSSISNGGGGVSMFGGLLSNGHSLSHDGVTSYDSNGGTPGTGGTKRVDKSYLVQTVIPKIRADAQALYNSIAQPAASHNVLEEGLIVEWIRTMMNLVVSVEKDYLASLGVSLKRPQFIHSLNILCRKAAFATLKQADEREFELQIAQMEKENGRIEAHFLLIVQGKCGDMETARNFAEEYNKCIQSWITQEINLLCTETRQAVLADLPDPARAFELAYQRSFAARNYREALEYVLDVNAYVEKIFLTLFYRKKQFVVDGAIGNLLTKIQNVYGILVLLPEKWHHAVCPEMDTPEIPPDSGRGSSSHPSSQGAQDEESNAGSTIQRLSSLFNGGSYRDGDEDTVTTTSSASKNLRPKQNVNSSKKSSPRSTLTINSLQRFIETHAAEIPKNDVWVTAFQKCAECLPYTADFPISDSHVFTEAFKSRITELRADNQVQTFLEARIAASLKEHSTNTWSLVRGCASKCPMCGSKCDQLGPHIEHHNRHHLFPAFHGWMDRVSGKPNFNYCTSDETKKSFYRCSDGQFRGLEAFLNEYHELWTLDSGSSSTNNRRAEDLDELKSVWVNCRVPLFSHYKLMLDETPEEWIELYEEPEKMLDWNDLQAAKETIRRVRKKIWVPDDGMIDEENQMRERKVSEL